MAQNQERLLREYISFILTEEGGGDGGGDSGSSSSSDSSGYAMGMGYGSAGGYSTDVSSISKPFKDVFNVLKGTVKGLFQTGIYLAKVKLLGLLQVATGGLFQANFASYRNTYRSALSSIKSQYSQSINDSYKSLFSNDLASAVLLFNAPAYFGAKIAKSVIESKILFEADGQNAATQAVRAEVIAFFNNIEKSMEEIKNVKTVEDLSKIKGVDAAKIKKELEEKEGDAKKNEQALVSAIKQMAAAQVIDMLTTEKEASIKSLKGIPEDKLSKIVNDPDGLIKKYETEISKYKQAASAF